MCISKSNMSYSKGVYPVYHTCSICGGKIADIKTKDDKWICEVCLKSDT